MYLKYLVEKNFAAQLSRHVTHGDIHQRVPVCQLVKVWNKFLQKVLCAWNPTAAVCCRCCTHTITKLVDMYADGRRLEQLHAGTPCTCRRASMEQYLHVWKEQTVRGCSSQQRLHSNAYFVSKFIGSCLSVSLLSTHSSAYARHHALKCSLCECPVPLSLSLLSVSRCKNRNAQINVEQ